MAGIHVGIQQFQNQGCLSYLCFDPATLRAVLIDPHVQLQEEYRSAINAQRFQLVSEIDTRTRKFSEGGRIELGAISLRVREVAGKAGPSIIIEVPGAVFCGDALEIGPVGTFSKDAEKILQGYPEETVLFPAHSEEDLFCSVVGHERVRRQIPVDQQESLRWTSLSVEKYHHRLHHKQVGSVLVDVREPEEFQAGHVPGARNIPLAYLGFHWKELAAFEKVYLVCFSGRRSLTAAKTLCYFGFPNVIHLEGGFQAWVSAGFES